MAGFSSPDYLEYLVLEIVVFDLTKRKNPAVTKYPNIDKLHFKQFSLFSETKFCWHFKPSKTKTSLCPLNASFNQQKNP